MSQVRKMVFTLSLFILIVMLSLSGCFKITSFRSPPNSFEVMVLEVIDGDTILISYPNQTVATVRFLGIDSPETQIQNNYNYEYENITNRSCLTYFGIKAKMFVTSLINNTMIRITFDNLTEKKDTYGRFLCYVSINQTDLNARLLEKGYARVFTMETFSRKLHYLDIQRTSINQLKGLWNCSSSQSAIVVSIAHYNAKGNDEKNLNDEYIVFVNTDVELVDLTDWCIRDDHGNQFNFPKGFTLLPHYSLTLYTGKGTDTANALYWGHGTPVWNNDGDTISLYNEKKELIETFSW